MRRMADERPTFPFEDVPLDEARRMGRDPRMEPRLYDTLRQKMQSLLSEATRLRLGPEIRPERMKHHLLHMARDPNVPVAVRRVAGGLLFWHSSDEDIQRAQETASRLQTARQRPQARPKGPRSR
jgi:hypothetical protein